MSSLPPRVQQTPEELVHLQTRLAFFEQPITMFNRPVENDPAELIRTPLRTRRHIVPTTSHPHKPATSPMSSVPTCFLVRFARRAMAAVRSVLTPRKRREKARLAKEAAARSVVADEFVAAARRRHQELDEPTRFRLELAGIRVQPRPFGYVVSV